MNKITIATLTAVAVSALASCSKEVDYTEWNTIEDGPEHITVTLSDATKTEYSFEDGCLKTAWAEGDRIAITPALYLSTSAGIYEAEYSGSSEVSFKKVEEVAVSSDKYGIFYPGDKIKSTAQFTVPEYSGQVQSKSVPMAHLADYHCMRTTVTDYSTIDFSDADQSACMKFSLGGMTFVDPVKIQLDVIGGGVFYLNNYVGSTTYLTSDTYKQIITTTSLSLDLEGYGTEDSLEAWMMMSNGDVYLYSGDILRVWVIQKDGSRYYSDLTLADAKTLTGGHCHILTINDGWTLSEGDFTEYEWDGDVVTLQVGTGALDLVLMGDGFIKEDFDNGTYEAIMRQAYEEFFSVEPYTTLKDDFNVYYVKTPSPERVQATNTGLNGAVNNGHVTKFSSRFTANSTNLRGDDGLVREYAKIAFSTDADSRIKDATIIVMVNQECRAGTCYNSWYQNNGQDYGQACAVAYCALGSSTDERIQLIHHEAGGHGFGKLADEYYYSSTQLTNTGPMIDLETNQGYGLYRNVDRYIDEDLYNQLSGKYALTNSENVSWHDLFGTVNNYESASVESLGVFVGANTYPFGFCRPTEDGSKSIMNANTGIFNAISRRAIYYRYRRLTGEVTSNIWGTSDELDAFLKWDADVIMPKLNLPLASGTAASDAAAAGLQPSGIYVRQQELPFAPPQLISGHWKDGRFYRD
jgi:hypothetical protein